MGYQEEMYAAASEAERLAKEGGLDAAQAYRVWCRVVHEHVAARIAEQDKRWAAAVQARLAADRLIYEGGLPVDHPDYLAACARADELGRLFREA